MEDAVKRPASFVLTDEEQKAFAAITQAQVKLGAQQNAVREFMKGVVQSGEARLTEINMEGHKAQTTAKKLWGDLAKKHGLDLTKVAYDLSDDGKSIVPISVNLQ